MHFDVITLFPDTLNVVTEFGVSSRAFKRDRWQLSVWNPRDYTHDVHRTVDDRPYGGGPGMVMLAEPLHQALEAADSAHVCAADEVILFSPAGKPFTQAMAANLATKKRLVLVCGRYEGIDQRFIDAAVTTELSMGDYVLSGGEIAALALIDSVVRLLPGVLHTPESAEQDSFSSTLSGLLDSPHYTRPAVYRDQAVPDTLLSGDHKAIARWRRQQSLKLSAERRPDLIEAARRAGLLSGDDEAFLASLP